MPTWACCPENNVNKKHNAPEVGRVGLHAVFLAAVCVRQCCSDGGAELRVFWYVKLHSVQLLGGREHEVALRQEREVAYHHEVFDA